MRAMNCLIIDDEPLALDLMESYVKQTPFLNLVKRCESAVDVLGAINELNVDLVFMDIQMPELNGVELSKLIKSDVMIIFATAFDKYALEGFKADAVDYLLKPISYPEFLKAANKALKRFELRCAAESAAQGTTIKDQYIFIKADYKLVQIKMNDILYVEGLKDYVKIYVENEQNPYISLVNIKSMEDLMPQEQFMRVHRSYIVNLNKVKIVDRSRIVFNKVYIPVSDTYKDKFNNFVLKRLVK